MQNDKVYTPTVIADTPFPTGQTQLPMDAVSSSANQTYTPTQTQDQVFPAKKIASELLSTALNTRSKRILQAFQFAPSGAIQIGDYTQGINGDIRISPAGITGRNSQGDTTFGIDGETGDAVFQGTIQGKNLVAGVVNVGDGDIQIDGESKRMIFFDSNGIPAIVIGNV